MTHTIEISLRVPSLRVHREGKVSPETIVNSDIRFIKRVEVEAVPKTGELLTMTVDGAAPFQCEVLGTIWQDDKNMFVATCRYASRAITEAQYDALSSAPDWHVKPLL
jgi:hypothetical protein